MTTHDDNDRGCGDCGQRILDRAESETPEIRLVKAELDALGWAAPHDRPARDVGRDPDPASAPPPGRVPLGPGVHAADCSPPLPPSLPPYDVAVYSEDPGLIPAIRESLDEAWRYVYLAFRDMSIISAPQNEAKRQTFWGWEAPGSDSSFLRWFGAWHDPFFDQVRYVLFRLHARFANSGVYGDSRYTVYDKHSNLGNPPHCNDVEFIYDEGCLMQGASAFAIGDGSVGCDYRVYLCEKFWAAGLSKRARILVHEFLHKMVEHQGSEEICVSTCDGYDECVALANAFSHKAIQNNDNYAWFVTQRWKDARSGRCTLLPSPWR